MGRGRFGFAGDVGFARRIGIAGDGHVGFAGDVGIIGNGHAGFARDVGRVRRVDDGRLVGRGGGEQQRQDEARRRDGKQQTA